MRIILLGTDIDSSTSGQARFLVNLARALVRRRQDVAIVTLKGNSGRQQNLASEGVPVSVLPHRIDSLGFNLSRMSPLNPVGSLLCREAEKLEPADWFVILSDDAVNLPLERLKGRKAYICNGDMALLYLNRSFFGSMPTVKRIGGLLTSEIIRSHSQMVERFDLLLANSKFTRQLMTYIYSVPFQGVVYPPVDTSVFWPGGNREHGGYALALARNRDEQGIDLLESIARVVPLRVVGGARVKGAECVGVVDDSQLAALYRGAQLLLFPAISEPFGYAVAESNCCGTPVVAFDSGGPAEIVGLTNDGRLARTRREFIELATRMFVSRGEGVKKSYPHTALSTFSLDSSATMLLDHLSR